MAFKKLFLSLKKSKLLLLLLAIFFLKQLLMVAVFPVFQGPDETVHYARIQYLAEPQEKTWERKPPDPSKKTDSKDISTRNFSEELINTAELVRTDEVIFSSSTTPVFSETDHGPWEETIKNSYWKKYLENSQSNLNKNAPAYYIVPSLMEKLLAQNDIFFRFFTERIFSAFLGVLIILLIYLIARKIGWDEKIAVLTATLVAFQPMFSQAAAIINYDILLIFTFTLFIYGAVWSLKDGLTWTNGIIMLSTTALGIITKAPAIILALLLFVLAIYFARKHLKIRNDYFIAGTIIAALIALIILENVAPGNHLNLLIRENNSHFDSAFQSVSKYISITLDRWSWSELSFWGNFGWLDTEITDWIVDLAHLVEIISIAGLIAYFAFPRKIPAFLPKRIFILFLLGIFIYLQLAIRFADWNHFDTSGKIEIGTHGRYFLPAITAQFILISIGLGMLARKYHIWKNILKVLSLSMILLWAYSLLIIIIPRYYL